MKEEEIKNLLAKYYKGDTSLDEETALRNYFSGDNVSYQYGTEKEIFSGISDLLMNDEPSDDLELRIIRNIDGPDTKTGFLRRRVINIISIAAAVFILLIGSYFLFSHNTDFRDTYDNPEIAYNEAIRILKLVTIKLDMGTEGLKPVAAFSGITEASFRSIDGSASMIRDNLQKLELIDKMTLNVPDNK